MLSTDLHIEFPAAPQVVFKFGLQPDILRLGNGDDSLNLADLIAHGSKLAFVLEDLLTLGLVLEGKTTSLIGRFGELLRFGGGLDLFLVEVFFCDILSRFDLTKLVG